MTKSERVFDSSKLIKRRKNLILEQLANANGRRESFRNLPFDELPPKAQSKIKADVKFNSVIPTLNEMESWSLYIEKGIVYYNLVYRETHHDYICFINEFKDVLKSATSKDDKYYACHYVYRKMRS